MPVQDNDTHAVSTPLLLDSAVSRRGFLGRAGALGLGLAATAMLAGCGGSSSSAPNNHGAMEEDVLNFALNLEYLEAEFYSYATTGSGLSSADTGGTSAGAVTGGAQVSFSDPQLAQIAAQIAADELAHVRLLRSVLGSSAVPQPAINLNPLNLTFTSQDVFLTYSRDFEDTGVSAYAGAATYLSGNILQTAAQILATEAYHAGNIRLEVVQKGITISPLDSVDQPPTSSDYFQVDSNGLAIKRTPSQVLAIVYANSASGTNKGGFFPNGVNGPIHTV